MINAQVEKNSNENTIGLLRRFSRRVQGTGILRQVRSQRYFKRSLGGPTRKKQALGRIQRKQKIEHLIKMGKMQERKRTRRR